MTMNLKNGWTGRLLCAAALAGFGSLALAFQDSAPPPAPPAEERPMTPDERLRAEINSLLAELQSLRTELAQARLRATEAERELTEMRQFIADHDVYGTDFEQYRAVREIAERDQRRRETEAARQRRDAETAERRARQEAARAQRDAQRAEAREVQRYRQAGFASLGLDVWLGPSSFHYRTFEPSPQPLRFDPLLGFYHQDAGQITGIDYSQMTISGSVLNGLDEIRNIGIAVTFFDERGNQVGHEIIQIENARPNVPYPFTSSVQMALDRPFSSSSVYVLYADPVP